MDRRDEQRSQTQDNLRITIGGTGLRCAMRNLSPSGCMIECRDLIADVGTPVEVVLLPGYVAQGEVAWQLGESIGIFFLEPISMGVVRHFALDDWMLRSDWSAANWQSVKG
ncbi:MAG: PilZ domain-containing protein [Erythrobacter sp.]|nr:PilZ domain-containing protein [Erythrobacter sp.]